jgi:hypothetical protein
MDDASILIGLVSTLAPFLCFGCCCFSVLLVLGVAIFLLMRKKDGDNGNENGEYAARHTEPLKVGRASSGPPVATGPVADKFGGETVEAAPSSEEAKEVKKPKRNPTLIFSPDDNLEDE